jgi:hypothetical protein
MKRIIVIPLIAASIGFLACPVFAEQAVNDPESSITLNSDDGEKTTNVDLLFVQNAKSMEYRDGKLVLKEVNPITVCFADRPSRLAGHMPTEKFVPMWSEGKNSFLKDPPNATLSIYIGDKMVDSVVELSNPQLADGNLSYDLKILEGEPPAEGGACSLFIDIIGCPLTPFSYAGATRRAFRRGAIAAPYARYGAYGAYAPYGALYGPPRYGPSIVHYGPYGTTVVRP